MKITTMAVSCLLLAGVAAAETTVFVNVNVIDVTSGAVAMSQTVVIEDEIIVEIGRFRETPVADDATVIDGTDRYLMPGLTEMHGHVPGGGAGLERILALYVVNGVTTVRGEQWFTAFVNVIDSARARVNPPQHPIIDVWRMGTNQQRVGIVEPDGAIRDPP